MGPGGGGGKGRAALILAFGKAKGAIRGPKKPSSSSQQQDESEEAETGKEARLSMARQMITAMKAGDAEGLKMALEDFIASS